MKEIENRCSVDAAILDSAKYKYERGTKFMEKMITRKEAAKMLGISINALDEARSTGMISYIQYVENGCVYFTETALQEFVARCTHRARPLDRNPTYRKRRV